MENKSLWYVGPCAFVALLAILLVVWVVLPPETLVHYFDQNGYSPFELATIPFFLVLVPLVWWKCPFEGSRTRRNILCALVSVVALFAVIKELDLHLMALHALYPDFVTSGGTLASGFTKPDGRPLVGTPFKMRVLTNAAFPLGLKACVFFYFTAFFGSFALGFAYLFPAWLKGIFRLEGASWAWGCAGASGVLVQISDRLPAWLGHAGGLGAKHDEVVTRATSLCTCLEEGGEMMLALMAILTILLAARNVRNT